MTMGKRGTVVDVSVDSLPPHSLEGEQGILGCVLLDPKRGIEQVVERFGDGESDTPPFYDQRHQLIWDTILEMSRNGEMIDLITLPQRLKDANELESAGGLAYVGALIDKVPSAANLPHYLAIVSDKLAHRKIIRACDEVMQVTQEGGDILRAITNLEISVSAVRESLSTGTAPFVAAGIEDLLEFDTQHDPDTLLGLRDGITTRFICRSGSGWLIGPSGHGKSSLAFQMAYCWAAGRPAFGITPTRPLRILIIQAENDKGDMAEMAQGISAGLGIDPFSDPDAFERVSKNIRVVSEGSRIGQSFCRWLRHMLKQWPADLVLVDPLLSFAGIDVSRQDQCSQFLRVWLEPVLRDTGTALIGVHHTGKPTKDPRSQPKTPLEHAYAGLGSSELVNWVRAIMTLNPVDGGTYALHLSKRGKRAGATHLDGCPTTTIWLRHAHQGICWEQTNPPEEKPEEGPDDRREQSERSGRPSKQDDVAAMNLHSFLAACQTEGEGLNLIAKRLEAWLAKEHRKDVSLKTCKRIIPLMVANGKLTKGEDALYRKGPNA